MNTCLRSLISACAALAASVTLLAQGIAPELQAKVDAQVSQIKAWASDPVILEAVKAQNAAMPAELAGLTQEKWRTLTVLDPIVRGLSKNAVATFLKTKKSAIISEAFVSAANGTKVGFLAKTTSWSHLGSPKHDKPLAGSIWQGTVEIDESTGLQQLQVSVPVLDGDKPVGSLVVGISLTKLAE